LNTSGVNPFCRRWRLIRSKMRDSVALNELGLDDAELLDDGTARRPHQRRGAQSAARRCGRSVEQSRTLGQREHSRIESPQIGIITWR
jgi:hypothetical protein